MRQIFLDTETTGLDYKNGHRIIEFGAVELVNRKFTGNNLHYYFYTDVKIDSGAFAVHGISNKFLADKPKFSEKAEDIKKYLQDSEVIIHNAPFDSQFLNWGV